MSTWWHITIETFPFSTGAGQEADQKAAGERKKTFRVRAEDFHQAASFALTLAAGVKANPAVWMANIVGVVKVGDCDPLPAHVDEVAA